MDEGLFLEIRDRLVALARPGRGTSSGTDTVSSRDGSPSPVGGATGSHSTITEGPALAKRSGVGAGAGVSVSLLRMPAVARSMWAFAMLGQYDEELYRMLTNHGQVGGVLRTFLAQAQTTAPLPQRLMPIKRLTRLNDPPLFPAAPYADCTAP